MRLGDLVETSIFRLTAAFAVIFALSALLLFAFIYWQTAVYENGRIDSLLKQEADILSGEPDEVIRRTVETRLAADIHRVTFAGLFDGQGEPIAGNLRHAPAGLPPDGIVRRVDIDRTDTTAEVSEEVLAVGRALPDRRILVLGRSIDELYNLRSVVLRALELGVIPAVLLALFAGTMLSFRAIGRVAVLNQTVERIRQGDLRGRLPVRGSTDQFDRLAASVNRMLDEVESLVERLKGVTDNIAHDLRTPLARMYARLDRARAAGSGMEGREEVIEHALADLNLTIGIITALLRISEIEDGRRAAAFGEVDLGEVARVVVDLYEPTAEENELRFEAAIAPVPPVHGDRDLLIEAVANLVDNAIKFTPRGGNVRVEVAPGPRAPVLRVADTGPGIPESEREAVFQRFYRSDKSRHVKGSGLGLSLVRAIVDLHRFHIAISRDHPGTVFELTCGPAEPAA